MQTKEMQNRPLAPYRLGKHHTPCTAHHPSVATAAHKFRSNKFKLAEQYSYTRQGRQVCCTQYLWHHSGATVGQLGRNGRIGGQKKVWQCNECGSAASVTTPKHIMLLLIRVVFGRESHTYPSRGKYMHWTKARYDIDFYKNVSLISLL